MVKNKSAVRAHARTAASNKESSGELAAATYDAHLRLRVINRIVVSVVTSLEII